MTAKTVGNEIAERYGRALIEIAIEKECVDEMDREFDDMDAMMNGQKIFRSFLTNPLLSRVQQKSFIEGWAEKANLSKRTTNFLMLLAENRRLSFLGIIIGEWKKALNVRKNQVVVELESAKPLTDAQKKKLKQAIEKKITGTVLLKERVAPELIGGIKVKMDAVMVDFSVKNQLKRLGLSMRDE